MCERILFENLFFLFFFLQSANYWNVPSQEWSSEILCWLFSKIKISINLWSKFQDQYLKTHLKDKLLSSSLNHPHTWLEISNKYWPEIHLSRCVITLSGNNLIGKLNQICMTSLTNETFINNQYVWSPAVEMQFLHNLVAACDTKETEKAEVGKILKWHEKLLRDEWSPCCAQSCLKYF